MDNKYTGREIAIFADCHSLLEPTKAVLEDIKKRGIKEIYSLGDQIGLGPNPKEVLDLLEDNNVICISGNSEDYQTLGFEPFDSYFTEIKKRSMLWTKDKLTKDQLEKIKSFPHSIDLILGGKKIALCHFANDVRIDYTEHSTWTYKPNVDRDSKDANSQFEYTNSKEQKRLVEEKQTESPYDAGYSSYKSDPLFGGKTIDYYDEVIQGHVHFGLYSDSSGHSVRTVRAAGMGYGPGEKNDEAYYIILREKQVGYDVEEVYVPFNREKMISSILNSDAPEKDTMRRFTGVR